VLLCVGAAGYVGARVLTGEQRAYAQVKAKPFTLRLDFYSYGKTPAGELYAREITARRSDGTTVTARTVGTVEKNLQARFLTVPGRDRVEAHDALGLKTTWPSSPQAGGLLDRLSSPRPHCLYGDFVLFRDDIVLGHPVSVVRRERGSERTTCWYAEDLGCETLGYTYEQKLADGAWKVNIVERATALVLGEPEPSQFTIPPTLTEATPSETNRRYFQLLGAKRTTAERQSSEPLDQPDVRQGRGRNTAPAAAREVLGNLLPNPAREGSQGELRAEACLLYRSTSNAVRDNFRPS